MLQTKKKGRRKNEFSKVFNNDIAKIKKIIISPTGVVTVIGDTGFSGLTTDPLKESMCFSLKQLLEHEFPALDLKKLKIK